MQTSFTYSLEGSEWRAVFDGIVVERALFDRRARAIRRDAGWQTLIVTAYAVSFAIWFVIKSNFTPWAWILPMAALLLPSAIAYIFKGSLEAHRKDLADQWFAAWSAAKAQWSTDRLPSNTLTIDQDGVTFDQSLDRHRQVFHAPWHQIRTIERLDKHIVFVDRSSVLIPLPMAAIGDHDHVRKALESWNAHMLAAEPQADQRFATFLAATAQACPHCRYSLSGLTKRRCPECGRKLMLDRHGKVVEDDSPVAPAPISSRPSAKSR